MTDYDKWLAALCLWREGRSCSASTLTCIWWVIQNRVNDAKRRWPRTISGVIAQHAQFSSMTIKGDPNTVAWPVLPTLPQEPTADWSAWLTCQAVVECPLGSDPTMGATMYESEPEDQRPPWATPDTLTMTSGPFRFYRR